MIIFLIDFLYMILAGVVVMSNSDILQEATLFQKGIAILIMIGNISQNLHILRMEAIGNG